MIVPRNVAAEFGSDSMELSQPPKEGHRGGGHGMTLRLAGTEGARVWNLWAEHLLVLDYVRDPETIRLKRREDLSIMPSNVLHHDMGGHALEFAQRIARGAPATQSGADGLESHRLTWAMDHKIQAQMQPGGAP